MKTMLTLPTSIAFLFLPMLASGEECIHDSFERVTDDFYFSASSDQAAVGDVIAVDITLTLENVRSGLVGVDAVLCYDASIAEPLEQAQYSDLWERSATLSFFVPLTADSGRHGLYLSAVLSGNPVGARDFVPNQPLPLATVFFRLKGSPGDSFSVQFCDAVFTLPSGPCRSNYLYYRVVETGEHFPALSTRHVAGQVRVIEGEPTRPDPPSLPPEAKVYPEAPTAETSNIHFELSGSAVQPGAIDVPLDLHVTSNYEFSGFSVSLTFPAESLELARVEEHTRPGIVHIDNADGSLGMLMINSFRRVGREEERVKIATLYFNVKLAAALGAELTPTFEPRGLFVNWLGIRHTNGLNDQELPVTAQVAPLQVTNGVLKIQAAATSLGDVNLDYELNLTDPVGLLNHLFLGESLLCPEAADFTEDNAVNITDPVAILNYLFLGGPAASEREVFCGRE